MKLDYGWKAKTWVETHSATEIPSPSLHIYLRVDSSAL